jgi:hypothetical protein
MLRAGKIQSNADAAVTDVAEPPSLIRRELERAARGGGGTIVPPCSKFDT